MDKLALRQWRRRLSWNLPTDKILAYGRYRAAFLTCSPGIGATPLANPSS